MTRIWRDPLPHPQSSLPITSSSGPSSSLLPDPITSTVETTVPSDPAATKHSALDDLSILFDAALADSNDSPDREDSEIRHTDDVEIGPDVNHGRECVEIPDSDDLRSELNVYQDREDLRI